jgi:lipoprotein-anchoring transpeptidase ErfK/SrfK
MRIQNQTGKPSRLSRTCAAIVAQWAVTGALDVATIPPPDSGCSPAVLDVQVALDRAGFSPGEIDGRPGSRTTRAIAAFQSANGVTGDGRVDCSTWQRLSSSQTETLTTWTISPAEVAGPFIESIPEDLPEQAKLPALAYTSPLEALAEKFHSSPTLLEKLNPGHGFAAGESITVPNVITDEPDTPPAQWPDVTVIVTKQTGSVTVKSADGRVLLHAPVTVGSERDPLPIGTWKVTGVQLNPTFFYNPALFWDAEPSHSKAKIPPGPNNPVGVVWIDIDKEHYGLHGTPRPSQIGYTESHGCVRLTNWDAMRVAKLVKPGTKVIFE